MTPIPPAMGMQRAPLGPASASGYSGVPRAADVPPAGQGLPRLIFGATKMVETIVRAVPSAAEEGDKISQLLQQIMVKASGAQGQTPRGAY